MGGRYLVTGVQLGILKGTCLVFETPETKSLLEIINQIEKQYLGFSSNDILIDVEKLQKFDFT